jgi:hypothetical protein
MTQEGKVELGRIALFTVVGMVGLTLIIGTLFGRQPQQVKAQGGLEAIATPVGCDLLEIDGRQYAVCEDGSQWSIEELQRPFVEAMEGDR